MKYTKILFIVVLIFFLFQGCASKKRVVVIQKELPSWYINPAKTTSKTLYAVAEGETKAEAIANALSEMIATLSVSISSEFHTKSVVKEGDIESIQKVSLSDIRTKVQQIQISHYEVIESKDFSFERYLVFIKADKKSLFSSLEKSLKQKFEIIENQNTEAKNYYAIKELEIYKKSWESLKDIQSTLAVMHSLNPDFNSSIYINDMNNVKNKYEKLASQISFSVESNNDAQNLRTSVQKGLSAKKYKINKKNDKNHFRVYISSTTTKAKSYGFELARSAIAITVEDYKGTIVGSNKLNITGQSTQGYKIAQENVAVKLSAKIAKEGIANIIGLEI